MKKYILILSMVLGVFTLQAQTPQVDSTNLVTVKDTSFVQDARLTFMVQTILPAMQKFVDDYNRQAKVNGTVPILKQETNQFLRKVEKEVETYALKFMVIKDIQVDSTAIVTEYEALNQKIQELQADPEAKYIEVMSEFKRIQERKAKLANYYNQLK